MARNREFLNATPPQSSDEEDDDDTSSEGISETDSDASIKTPVKTQPPKEEEEDGEDDDESGSETDSGSDSDSPAKPLAAKKLVEEARIVSRSKTISPESAAATPVQSAATKRPAEHSSASKEPKKMKAGDAEAEAEAEAEASEKKSFMMKIGEAESSEKTSVTKKSDEADSSEKKSLTKEADEAESLEKQSVLKKADEAGPSEKKSNLFQRLWSEDGEESSAAKRERDLMNVKGEEKLAGGGSGSGLGLGSLSVGRTTDEVMTMTGQERIGGTKEWDLLREQEIEAAINLLKVRVRQYEQVLSYMRSKRSNGSGSG